jgi:hypothetical protein
VANAQSRSYKSDIVLCCWYVWAFCVEESARPTGRHLFRYVAVRTSFGRLYILSGWSHTAESGLPETTFAFRASEDGGMTWDDAVYNATVRRTDIDGNTSSWANKWTVDRFTVSAAGVATLAFTKYSGLMVAPEEVFFLSSPNLLTETNASAVTWDTMPEGPRGLAPPGGNPGISE